MFLPDFSFLHALAIGLIIISWSGYSHFLKFLGHGTLNSRLELARYQWITEMTGRDAKPFDAVLLGHIVHSVGFFGSATLIVLAGVLTAFISLDKFHKAVSGFPYIQTTSFELFTLQYSFLVLVLVVCFFSFTYALRKLIYAISLVGALPDGTNENPVNMRLVGYTATVLSESLKTFNFGIRGYYYAVASLFLFISPWLCVLVTLITTFVLVYRQMATTTSRAIIDYVECIASEEDKASRQ